MDGNMRSKLVLSCVVVWMFLVSVLGVLVSLPNNVEGVATSQYSDGATDGYIVNAGGVLSLDTALSHVDIGQYQGVSDEEYRAFISFDTSTIPIGAVITSALLKMYLDTDFSDTDFGVRVYLSNFTTLDTGDWDYYTTFEGTLLDTASASSGNWYQTTMNPDHLNTTGPTQYELISSRTGTAPTGLEYVMFQSGDATNRPILEVFYTMRGTTVHIERSGGLWLNETAFPDVQEWNLTYELDCYEIASVPDAINITIDKQEPTWIFKGVTPGCNYTDDPTFVRLEDVFDSITYRVWLAVPKSNPYCTVHVSLYNAFTGEGYFFEQMKVQMCDGATWDNTTAQWITKPDFYVEPNATYTFRVLDYFENVLVEYSYVANSQDIYIQIPVPAYSWQIFNMNDAPVLMSIYWNNSGSPWQFFVGPHWIIERFLKGGNYTFLTTFYNSDGTAGSTVYFNRTVPMTGLNASFIYINGTTLFEIISSVEGVMATQMIITSLVSPSMLIVYEDLPLAPVRLRNLAMSTRIAIDPYLILEATTYQNQTGLLGVNSTLFLPHPTTVGATYYIVSDVLSFSGTFATTVYVNSTDGTNLYYNTILPATILLDGQNVTVWANNNYSVSRACTWREISEYTVTYYSTQKKYECTLSLNNSMGLDYYSPYWYISFPQNTTIDLDTVTLYDLDNAIYLSQRTNFDVTGGGVHVTLNRLNASNARNFRLTYWDENGTTGLGAPNLIAESYTQSSLNGISMKYTAVQWMNPWSVEYRGEIYISLNFSTGDSLLRSSITIIDETTGNVIPNSQWVYTGRTLIILTDGVGTVPVGGARNFGVYFTLDAAGPTAERQDFFFGPIVYSGKQFFISNYAVSWAMVLIIFIWGLIGWRWWIDDRNAMSYAIIWASVMVIVLYFGSMLGG